MLFDGLLLCPLWLVMLLLMPLAVEGVCPYCFGGLPSCSWGADSKCPADTTMAENIALVAAVSTATAIAGGKFLKMPGVWTSAAAPRREHQKVSVLKCAPRALEESRGGAPPPPREIRNPTSRHIGLGRGIGRYPLWQ